MTCVISLDLGTLTGWALWQPGWSKPRVGLAEMPDVERDMGWWGESFLEWLVPFCRLNGVTEIVVEAPIIVPHKRAGSQPCPTCGHVKTDINAHEIEKLVGLSAFAALGARQLTVPFHRAARSTVCKHFIAVVPGQKMKDGRRADRKYLKGAFVIQCGRKGWNTQSEDIADALGTLDWFLYDRDVAGVPWNCDPAPGPLFEGLPGVRIEKANQVAAKRLVDNALKFDREKNRE